MTRTWLFAGALLAVTTGLSGIEVLHGDEKPAGCEQIAEIRAGDLFNRLSKDIARQSVIEDAEKLGAQKVSVQLIAHVHPKLGKSYTARGIAWKCEK